MHGPAAAFLPPLYAYTASVNCQAGENDYVPEEEWLGRLQEVQIFFPKLPASGGRQPDVRVSLLYCDWSDRAGRHPLPPGRAHNDRPGNVTPLYFPDPHNARNDEHPLDLHIVRIPYF